jgi:hypothetical protein
MIMNISGTYSVTKWDEHQYQLIEEHKKLTKATVEFEFNGDLKGTAFVEYLMFYSSFDSEDMHASEAQYRGQMRVVGNLNGKNGSFVLSDIGTFKSGIAKSTVVVIPGSGTGELSNIMGDGSYAAQESGCTWEMEIDV